MSDRRCGAGGQLRAPESPPFKKKISGSTPQRFGTHQREVVVLNASSITAQSRQPAAMTLPRGKKCPATPPTGDDSACISALRTTRGEEGRVAAVARRRGWRACVVLRVRWRQLALDWSCPPLRCHCSPPQRPPSQRNVAQLGGRGIE